MNCSNCGAPLTEDSKFCPNCGTPVPQADPDRTETESAQAQTVHAEPYAAYENTGREEPKQNAYTDRTYVPPYTAQSTQYDVGIQARDIAVAIILSVVTCGIYNIFWFIKMVDDVNRAANDQSAFSGGLTWLLSFVTGGIYGWYWYYQAGKKMAYAKQVRNMPVENQTEILYLVLAIFGMGIINMALIQNDLNKMASPRN